VQDAPANTDFAGWADVPGTIPDPASGWRWGLVAVSPDGVPRYSALQRDNSGELDFALAETDEELWMVVVGAPSQVHQIRWDQLYPTIYRFPWMVQVDGAWPEGFQPDAPPPGAGGPHVNGGGWVSSSASVSPSAYVGPHAMVLGGTVSGNARIEGHAVVYGGTVSDNAVVGGGTLMDGSSVSGSARVETVYNMLTRNISGTAQLYGDMELEGDLSSGVYYGFVPTGSIGDAAHGAGATVPLVEVTAPGPYTWD